MKSKLIIVAFAVLLIAACFVNPLLAVGIVLIACLPLSLNRSLGMKNLVARPDGTIVTDLQNFLLDQLEDGQAETIKAINSGRIFFDTISYYMRFNITGASGKTKILDETTKKEVGVTNFNLGALPKFVNFAFNKIGIAYATTNTANANVGALNTWTKVRGSFDPALTNAELILSRNGAPFYESPISNLLREVAATNGASFIGDYELEQPRLIKESEPFAMEINFGKNLVSNTVNTTQAVEVQLHGIQIRLKAA